MKYKLSADVRCLIRDNKILLRKGIWNCIDGVLEWATIVKSDLPIIQSIFSDLSFQQKVDASAWESLSSESHAIFRELIKNRFLISIESDGILDFQHLYMRVAYPKINNHDFFIITNNKYIEQLISDISAKHCWNREVCSEVDRVTIEKIGLNPLDPVDYEANVAIIKKIMGQRPILIIDENISLPLVRNINRSLSNGIPMFLGFLDGPFLIYLSFVKGEGPCFECYEQRMLARLQDHVLYHDMMKEHPQSYNTEAPATMAAMTFLLHQAYSDLYSYALSGKPQFTSRALHIYLPTFEIQYNDVLKISSCPCCGGYLSNNNSMEEISLRNFLLQRGEK